MRVTDWQGNLCPYYLSLRFQSNLLSLLDQSATAYSTNMSVYVPLPHTGEVIRLLALAPGKSYDELVAKFIIHDLQDTQPEYTATSYVCGDDNRFRHHPLIPSTEFGIYKNADAVLRRLRSNIERPTCGSMCAVSIKMIQLRRREM